MSAPDLDAIQARLDARIPGADVLADWVRLLEDDSCLCASASTRWEDLDDLVLALAAARSDLAALLAEVKRLTAERDLFRRVSVSRDDVATEEHCRADVARAERDEARAALAALLAVLREWGAANEDRVTDFSAGDDLADNIRENGAWRLVRDLAAVLANHPTTKEARDE